MICVETIDPQRVEDLFRMSGVYALDSTDAKLGSLFVLCLLRKFAISAIRDTANPKPRNIKPLGFGSGRIVKVLLSSVRVAILHCIFWLHRNLRYLARYAIITVATAVRA